MARGLHIIDRVIAFTVYTTVRSTHKKHAITLTNDKLSKAMISKPKPDRQILA